MKVIKRCNWSYNWNIDYYRCVIFVFLHLKSGSGREIGSENTSKLSKETSKDKDEIVIKVTETKIYIDDKECEDVSELRDEISKF